MVVTDKFDGEMVEILGKLKGEQAALYTGAFEVDHMYKLPMPPVDFEFI